MAILDTVYGNGTLKAETTTDSIAAAIGAAN